MPPTQESRAGTTVITDILVRPARTEDAAEAARVLCRSICVLCDADHRGDPDLVARWTANKTPGHVRRWILGDDLLVLVALRDARILGVGAMAGTDEIALLYVAPEVTRSGVGAALLSDIERRMRANGAQDGRLTSTRTAEPFYTARGWTPQGDTVIAFGLPGQAMVKRLA